MKTSKKRSDNALSTAKLCVLITLGFMFVTIPLISLALDPIFLIMKYVTRIAVGSLFYNRMLQENVGARIELYIFNITNSAAFLSGEDHKLKLEEVGPFNYQEFRVNKDFELDEEGGVMRYFPHIRTEFLEHSSMGDPRSINVSVPNISFLSISSMFSSYPFWTKTAFNVIASQLQSQPIVNLNVHNYLWGYDDPLIALSHRLLPGWIHFESIGILDRLYDQSAIPLLEVSTKNEDKFQVKSMNRCKGLNMLGYEDVNKRSRCNTFEDTYEGYAFIPGMTKDGRIRLYRNIFCRMVDLELVSITSNEVSPLVFVYDVSNSTYSINSNNECLCPNKHQCTDGASSMAPCLYGLGIGLSNAHFLHANPKTYERVEGMNPSQEKHGSRIVIDPRVGAVLSASFMIQVNVLMEDVSFNAKVKPFAKMTVPVAYFKIISEASEEVKKDISALHNVYPYIIHTIEFIIFLVGLVILAYVACQIYGRLWIRSSTTGFKDSNITKNNHVHILQETPLMDEKIKSFRLGIF